MALLETRLAPDTLSGMDDTAMRGSIDLFWLPIGAGGYSVRWNGRIYEALAALHEGRPACDIYHSALEVRHGGGRYVIEMGPAWGASGPNRGVVCGGPVGAKWLGRFRLFRYEVRGWRDGLIPDAAQAVQSPRRLSEEPQQAGELLVLLHNIPSLTWGRDEIASGEMWNSNSVVSWLLASTGHDMNAIQPPIGGRAPGWQAGLVMAEKRRTSHREVPQPAATGVR